MDNTIYIAATGMRYRTQSLNVTGNNLANLETAGFKRSELISSTFGEYVTFRNEEDQAEIGSKTHGTVADSIYTDFTQGTINPTGNACDFALNGSGFFTVTDAAGATTLTRDGHFNVDADGFLTDNTGNFVMGQNGKINVGNGNISVSENGVITSGGKVVDSLKITVVDDPATLEALAGGKLSFTGNGGVFSGKVIQGGLERSNVDLADEMTAMIKDSRAFQTCSQMVKMADQVLQKTVNEIGRV